MKVAFKLIFGIRTSGSISLKVVANAPLPEPAPKLLITTRGQDDVVISCSNNVWVAPLGEGDHVVRMPAPDASWFDGPVTFTLSAPAAIIRPGDIGGPLVTWTATVGTASTASDPKNPWPPPLAGMVEAGSLTDSTWFSSTLAALSEQMLVERSGPAHVLSAKAARRDRSG